MKKIAKNPDKNLRPSHPGMLIHLADFEPVRLKNTFVPKIQAQQQSNTIYAEFKQRNIRVADNWPLAGSEPDHENYQAMLTRYFKQHTDPLLVVHPQKPLKEVKRLVHLTDLRYCDTGILQPMTNLAKSLGADIFIVHISVDGLPDMENNYAEDFLKSEILPRMYYENVVLINLRKKDLLNDLAMSMDIIDPDIISLFWKRHSLFDKLFMNSDLRRAVYTRAPLLLFPSV
ncbi:hypothetical protein FW774_15815 [Pedobacter sp. BS3]|uniref:hypothetical protein n=1 Tax=Pedobacter sp. BS3 TaxID=2567937 RepID=UPI0011EBB354|nr:hypothetical protein [Pedobacter sp. BS3]TZF82156.1 hypothetical protein FW774_15815 [Pedobacter sp. BS3]